MQLELFPTHLHEDDKLKVARAIRALDLYLGHDSYANLKHQYGETPWVEVKKIRDELKGLLC